MVVSRSATICEIDTFITLLSSTITNCADAKIAIGSPSDSRAPSLGEAGGSRTLIGHAHAR
jgi:hypothetical protein